MILFHVQRKQLPGIMYDDDDAQIISGKCNIEFWETYCIAF